MCVAVRSAAPDSTGSSETDDGSSRDREPASDVGLSSGAVMIERLTSAGLFLFWAAWLGYGITLAPNQTPSIDLYYLEKLLNLHADDGFAVNSVVWSLWNMMGVLPTLFAALLIPASRTTRTRVPAWPFVAGSVALGCISLLPYFALWAAGAPSIPSAEDRLTWGLRLLESKFTAGLLLVASTGLLLNAATAPSVDWLEFGQIVQQSRLFHMTTSDFFVFVFSAPFWTYNDMAYRNWAPRLSWGVALLCLPILGPSLYLLLRPGLPPATPSAPFPAENPKP